MCNTCNESLVGRLRESNMDDRVGEEVVFRKHEEKLSLLMSEEQNLDQTS
jgi:hypothetical protein